MKHRHLVFIATFAASLLAPRAAYAATSEAAEPELTSAAHSAPVFTFYFENDAFDDTDRHYTNGVKLSWLSGDLNEWGQAGWRKRFVEALPFVNRTGAHKNFGFALGQNIYTPQDITLVPPDANDRPYAGWTYVELTFASKTDTLMDALSFQIGMVGPHSYAEDAQRIVHEWLNNKRPAGWDYQLEDEVGVNIIFERKYRFYARTSNNTLGVDFVPHIGVSVGNVQTYASVGGTARVGFNLPNDFGVELIRPSSAGVSPVDGTDPRIRARGSVSFFIFGGYDGRAVARDIFLDGNTFEDSASVDKEPLVGDAYYGAGLLIGKWQLTYTQVGRSREFKTQRHANYFGSVALSRAF